MKKSAYRIFAAALAIVLTLSLCPWALADYPADTRTGVEGEYAGKTVILHSNDVHGEIMGYAYIAALKTEFESKGAEVILADAGDFSQGDVAVSYSKGADAILMMNAAGYDVSTLGNHEFDYGYEQLKENLKAAEFHVICADIFEGDKLIWDPNWMYEGESGLKIGFFGLDTPDTRTQANPAMTRGLTFLDQAEIYECAKEQISALRGAGADLVIALAHLGVNEGSESSSVDLVHHVEGMDLIIDGHSHTVMTAGEDGEAVQSTGTKFAYIGVVVIDNASKAIEDHYLLSTDGMSKDEAIAAKAQEIIDRVNAEYDVKFAESEIFLVGDDDARSVRTQETNLGDLITDAIVWKVLKENADVLSVDDGKGGSISVNHNHVVGVTNGGGIRVSLNAGNLTRKDLNTVLPFGNTVAVVFVSGAELLEALEASTYSAPEPLGGYPQTFGVEFTLDTAKPYAKGENYSSSYYKPASIERVTITKINGEPFDPNAIYAVVTNDFLAAGGDTYYSFKEARAQFDTGIPMDEAVIEYVDEALNGVVSAETYADPRGDQTILPAYAVSVSGGTGSGEYTKGVSVAITANAPESGKRFQKWDGADGLIFTNGNATAKNATFVMPSRAVNLIAVYEDIPSHSVTVNDGEGSETYPEGEAVSISATVPTGKTFDKWVGADGLEFTVGDANSESATFIMPDRDVTLTATFRDAGGHGCYVATAVYGSYDCPEVWTLRRFRDEVLAETWYGRLFIRCYYAVSPTAVKLFGDCEWFRNFFRDKLDTLVSDLQADGFDSNPYQDRAW